MVFIHFQELFAFVIQVRTGDGTGTQKVHQPPALLLTRPEIQGVPFWFMTICLYMYIEIQWSQTSRYSCITLMYRQNNLSSLLYSLWMDIRKLFWICNTIPVWIICQLFDELTVHFIPHVSLYIQKYIGQKLIFFSKFYTYGKYGLQELRN